MITVDYTTKNFSSHARTLTPEDLGLNASGWTIEGKVLNDYFEWVNYFEATHPVYGTIKGDFEDQVTGDSQEAIDHFVLNHPVQEWDYYDI